MDKKIKVGLSGWLVIVAVGLVAIGLLSRFVARSATGRTDARAPVYTVTDSFSADHINTWMWISADVRFDPTASLSRTRQAVRRGFRPNTDPGALLYGNIAYAPVGWAYVELSNATSQPQTLVLSMPHYRCTKATLFLGRGTGFDSVGTVAKTRLPGKRFFPFFNLAFPITLPPHTVLPVLLRTETFVGFHEVDVQLSQRAVYLHTSLIDTIRDGSQVLICLIIAAIALLIGWRSANRLLLSFGGYMLSLGVAFSCQYGYLFFFDYPAYLSVNADTLGTLALLLINITLHPFLYEVVKPALRHPDRYRRGMLVICAANALLIGLHVLPYSAYGLVSHPVSLGMNFLITLNVVWLAYFSWLAFRRAGIWSMLLICLLVYWPFFLNQLLVLVQVSRGQDPSPFRHPVINPLFIILALSYLTFEQFRKEVITRQLLQRQVRQVRHDINGLRRQEIEGIGRDLHDQVGNTLATALGYLSRLPTDTEKPRAIIINAIRELRFLSHNLVKDDDRPLTDKVETLVGRISDFSTIAISFADYTQQQIDQLSVLKQQNLYSIIQELLTNVIRHSQATQASVQFFCDGTTIDVSVEDDGIGFTLPTGKSSGIGIQNIYKRATLSGIEVLFDAAPNGTSVLLKTLLHDEDPHHSH